MLALIGVEFAAPALAQADTLRPFAPWMTLADDDSQDTLSAPDHFPVNPVKPQPLTANTKTPDAPVMTPQDTMALINKIYDPDAKPPSALEKSYSKRGGETLEQFGYDQFGTPKKSGAAADKKDDDAAPAGAVQDNFMLNSGDQLRVTFRGQRQDSKLYTVDSQGQVIIDDLPPLSAAGRTIGQLRDELQAQMGNLHNTEAFVSLDTVRQINVVVIGHVARPGRQTLTVFNTVLDALMDAGGVEKSGSLRQIRIVRGGRSSLLDLYGLLVRGSGLPDIALQDGDRIVVPPVGPTVAVAGGVKRPGVYEIRGNGSGGEKLSLQDMLGLAGGALIPGETRFIKLSLTRDGRESVTEVSNRTAPQFGDGSILKVETATAARTGTVELAGQTRRAGTYDIGKTTTLSALIDSDKVFGQQIYPLIGVIERRDEAQLAPQLLAFSPLLVTRGKFDRRLQDGDVVHLFSRTQIAGLQKPPRDKTSPPRPDDATVPTAKTDTPIRDPAIISFLNERDAFISGAVRQEGAWPVADGTTLANLTAVAGGFTLEASTGDIEVTSRLQGKSPQDDGRSGMQRITVDESQTDPADILIGPGDAVRVKQKFQRVADHSVLILGEVNNPGRYDLTADDHLSDLLKEAGGVTAQAYPAGAIFSRESERQAEEARFRAQAQELEIGLAAALHGSAVRDDDHSDRAVDQDKIGAAQELIGELKNAQAVGRITVEADPGVLAVKPEQDILLEPGDRIYIPKRPLTVRVAGEVLSPAALQFRKEKDGRDYITEAGGFTYNADADRAFVVYPDGSAQPLAVSPWNHAADFIPPGSTIIVPRDPKPFDFIQTARDVSQILSNLAITGIFVDDVRNNRD